MTTKYFLVVDNSIEHVFDTYENAVDAFEDVYIETANNLCEELTGLEMTWEQLEGALDKVRTRFQDYKFPQMKIGTSVLRLQKMMF